MVINTLKIKIAAFGAITTQMTSTATGLALAGVDPITAVIVAGGVGVVACEVFIRIFKRGNTGSGSDMAVA